MNNLLLKGGLKILYYAGMVYLVGYFIYGIALSLEFITIITKISIVNLILTLAVLSKLFFNISSFLKFKLIEEYSWIKTIIVVALIDVSLLITPFLFSLPTFLMQLTNNNEANSFFSQLPLSIKGIANSEYSLLNPFQAVFLKLTILYIIISLSVAGYFINEYKKEHS